MTATMSPQLSLRASTPLCWHYGYQTGWGRFKTRKTEAIFTLRVFCGMSKVIVLVQLSRTSGRVNVHRVLSQRLGARMQLCSSHSLALSHRSHFRGKHGHLSAVLNKPEPSTNTCNKEVDRLHCQIRAFFLAAFYRLKDMESRRRIFQFSLHPFKTFASLV